MEIIQSILTTGFFGVGVIVSSLILFAIGLPVQIYRNYRRKSMGEMSFPLFLLYFSAYLIWLSYGISIKELPIIIPNIFAVPAATVILIQFYFYRNASAVKKN